MSEKMRSGVLILFLVLGKFSATLLGHVFKPTMSRQFPSSSELNSRGYVDDSMNVSKYIKGRDMDISGRSPVSHLF